MVFMVLHSAPETLKKQARFTVHGNLPKYSATQPELGIYTLPAAGSCSSGYLATHQSMQVCMMLWVGMYCTRPLGWVS